jgi:hypothetical protein
MLRILCLVGVWLLAGLMILPACAEKVAEEPVVKLPPKEHTWVRKETVRKSKDAFFAKQDVAQPVIAINEPLLQRLSQPVPVKGKASVTDSESCLAVLRPLNQKRTAIQTAGGMWHAFERSDEVRAFSDNGMQMDSTMNKLISSLRHLCKSAKGLPQDNIARVISQKVAEKGKEAVVEEYQGMGEATEDVINWMEHAAYWKKNEKRDLDYKLIEGLMAQVEPMMGLYGELIKRAVDETTKQAFLSDAVTLLKAMKTISTTDEYLVLALNEDKDAPYENLDPDM